MKSLVAQFELLNCSIPSKKGGSRYYHLPLIRFNFSDRNRKSRSPSPPGNCKINALDFLVRQPMPCLSVVEPPEAGGELNLVPPFVAAGDLEERGRSGSGSDCSFYRISKEPEMSPSPAESSSIGMNSDEEREEEEGDKEIQGPLRELKASMDSLEEALPMRRGISSFYNGKSKSFTSLADASSHPSIKAIVKPETAYSRKRRNLLAYTLLSETNHHHHKNTKTPHLIKTHSGGISKKPVSFSSSSSSNRATLALAVAMANAKPTTRVHGNDDCVSPLSLRSFFHWRSFSLVDLQQCQPVVSSKLRSDDIS